jgi:hypothetical protein
MTESVRIYGFRPWVRRAGFSIVAVAAVVTLSIGATLWFSPQARFGWIGERFVWVYLGTLWIGGLKVWLGTMRPVAELGPSSMTLRPLHKLRAATMDWAAIRGTEQMMGGDRIIVYYETDRGMRLLAMNLNLIKGRRDFLTALDAQLLAAGFEEKLMERSRYLTR